MDAFSAAVSCLAPALNATTTSSLTLTKAWLAGAVAQPGLSSAPLLKLATFHK